MIGCNDPKYKCGQIVPSACIPFTGKDLTFVEGTDQLECDASINNVFFKMDAALKVLKDGSDLTELDLGCLVLDPVDADVTPFNVHQAEIIKICEIQADLTALTTQFNDLNIGTEVVTITLPACLAPDAAPCAVGTNQYQLISLLNLFATMLCDHETRISNLE